MHEKNNGRKRQEKGVTMRDKCRKRYEHAGECRKHKRIHEDIEKCRTHAGTMQKKSRRIAKGISNAWRRHEHAGKRMRKV